MPDVNECLKWGIRELHTSEVLKDLQLSNDVLVSRRL